MKKTIYLVIVSVFLLFGCKKNDERTALEPTGFRIEIKGISGWGDVVNISIDQNKTEVKHPAGIGSLPQTEKDKSYKTSPDTFKKISSYGESYSLMNAKIQEWARCADGTDYVITMWSEGRENTVTIAAHRTDGKYTDLLDFIGKL